MEKVSENPASQSIEVMNNEGYAYKSINVTYAEVKDRLDKQSDTIDAIDSKTGIILGFTATVSAIAFSRKYVLVFHGPKDIITTIISILAGVFLIISLILAIISYKPKTYTRDPNPKGLMKYLTETETKTKEALIDNWIDSFKENERTMHQKTKLFRGSLWFLLSGSFLLGILAFI
jgi:preprotein translocase subunit SecG